MPTQPRERPRILLVDSDPGVRFAIGDYFLSLGLAVDHAASTAEAEAWLARGKYAAVLLDTRFPDAEPGAGLALARRIRRETMDTVICILTLPLLPGLLQEARQVADVVLTRPRRLPDIAQIILALLYQRSANSFHHTSQE